MFTKITVTNDRTKDKLVLTVDGNPFDVDDKIEEYKKKVIAKGG